MHSHAGAWERDKGIGCSIVRLTGSGKDRRFLRSVPCGDAIKSFSESTNYPVSSWWYGLRGQSARKRRSFPEGDVPEQGD